MITAEMPLIMILFKLSMLLAWGWAFHGLMRHQHPRWRITLWRVLLFGVLLLPLTGVLPHPKLAVPIYPEDLLLREPISSDVAIGSASSSAQRAEQLTLNKLQGLPAQKPNQLVSGDSFRLATTDHFVRQLLVCWVLVAAVLALRLLWLHGRLHRLIHTAHPADSALVVRLQNIQQQLGVKRQIELRVSNHTHSPFAAGLLSGVIMLPEKLINHLSEDELTTLLAHEVAHFRRNDLIWCVAWRWAQAALWFHPLVWKIPAVHNLACEQEADRLASGRLSDSQSYAALLASLTLRVLAAPEIETRLVMNGGAQITRRLDHLARTCKTVWTWKHSVAGLLLALGLFLGVGGCEISRAHRGNSAGNHPATPSTNAWSSVEITVLDEAGRPIEGAAVKPFGFRVAGPRHVDGYGWVTNRFGPADPVLTDHAGKVSIKYPLVSFPDEKLLTDALTFTIRHPDYSTEICQDYPVNGTGVPFHLKEGVLLEVSAYYGSQHEAVTDLVPNLAQEGIQPQDWQTNGAGVYTYKGLTTGGHLLQLMGRRASGEIVFSDSIVIAVEPGKTNSVELKMKPGIRIEGRLDNRVARPVKNGRVIIAVRPHQIPAYLVPEDWRAMRKDFGYFHFWRTYRRIAEDGTFVFESVPPGEVDVIVHGDGFCSQSIGEVRNRINGQLTTNGPRICIPQPFALTAPVTSVEVKTEPTATLNLTVLTKNGKPIEGAQVFLNPNVLRIGGFFGWLRESNEKPYRALAPLPDLHFSARTDANGKAVVSNLPPEDRGLEVRHPVYVVPLKDRNGLPNRRVSAEFAPGQITTVTVVMEPAGRDYIGTAK
jgi:beta-lactamase regulating signal transducer with metallopeptidase domain